MRKFCSLLPAYPRINSSPNSFLEHPHHCSVQVPPSSMVSSTACIHHNVCVVFFCLLVICLWVPRQLSRGRTEQIYVLFWQVMVF